MSKIKVFTTQEQTRTIIEQKLRFEDVIKILRGGRIAVLDTWKNQYYIIKRDGSFEIIQNLEELI